MGRSVLLLLHYRGKKFDLRVEDIDEVNILDLLMDLDDAARKQIKKVLHNPSLKYYHPIEDCLRDVDGDVSLQNMFEAYSKETEVSVFIEETAQPSEVVQLARNLREEQSKATRNQRHDAVYQEAEVTLSDDEGYDATFVPPEPRRKKNDQPEPIRVQMPAVDLETGEDCYVEKPPPGPPRRKFRRLRSNAQMFAAAFEDQQEDEEDNEGSGRIGFETRTPTKSDGQESDKLSPQSLPKTPTRRRVKHAAKRTPKVVKQRKTTSKALVLAECSESEKQDQGEDNGDHLEGIFESMGADQREYFYTDMANDPSSEATNEQERDQPSDNVGRSQHYSEPSSPPPCTQTQEEADVVPPSDPVEDPHDFAPSQPMLLRQRKLSKATLWRIKKGLLPPPMPTTQEDVSENAARTDNVVRASGNTNAGDDNADQCRKRTVRFNGEYQFEDDGDVASSESDSDFKMGSVASSETLTSMEEETPEESGNQWEVNEEDDYKIWDDSSDEEVYTDRIYRNGQFYQWRPFGSIKLKDHDIFHDREDFLEVLSDYCVQERFDIVRVKSDTIRFTAECSADGCPWRIHSSLSADGFTWQIKTYRNEHTCAKVVDNKMATCAWLTRHLMTDVKANSDIPGKCISKLCLERYGLNVKGSLAFKVRDKCKQLIEGTYDESYAVLPQYLDMLRETNPGSFTNIPWSNEPPYLFTKCFVALEALVYGFKHGCRTLIGIDGCHLKGYYGGVLLSAVSLDANQEMFPFAYAIVGAETKETWT